MTCPPAPRALFLAALASLACSGGSAGPDGGAPSVSVRISPAAVTLPPLAQQAFTADVSGTTNVAVTWAIREGAAGGTVTAGGAYTAPAAAGSYHVVVTSVADPAKSAVASVTVVPGGTQDLCAGLVQDKLAHPMTPVTKPAVGASYVDPQFGTTIRRVSDAAGRGLAYAIPVYSTIQAFNADESYLILYHADGAHHLYDGRTYAYVKRLDISPADLEQVYWDASDPKILYYTDSGTRRLFSYDVDTGTAKVVHDFATGPSSCASISGGADPMWTSWDSRYFGYVCGASVFSYDRSTNTVGTVAAVSAGGNAPQPSPSGAVFFLDVAGAAQVRDPNMVLLRTLSVNGDEHATIGTSDGVDTLFSVQFDGAAVGTLVASNMATGANRVVVGEATGYPYPPSGTHLSSVAYKRPGWLTASIVGNPTGANVLDQEILLVNANTGGTVCRVGHHRSAVGPQGYWAEPHASISPSGTRIIFGSDWGGESRVETYVVELPGYAASR